MSSKRGRKRNDNLPPNRARDVQRAFRARRAAHLEALEQRVAELEEENSTLRAALSLPPANRPALGKGPTGKDKPKSHSQSLQPPVASGSTLPPISSIPQYSPTLSLHSASRTNSPSSTSTRTQSLSPTAMNTGLGQNPHTLPSIGSNSWDEDVYMGKEGQDPGPPSSSTHYPLAPIAGSSSSHAHLYAPSPSRQPISAMYSPVTPNYPHTADRPMGGDPYSGSGMGYSVRDNRRTISFPQHSFPTPSHMPAHPSPVSAISPTMPPQGGSMSMQSPTSYAHRRSITEPQGFRPVLSHPLPHIRLPQPPSQGMRLPSPGVPPGNPDAVHSGYGMSGDRRLDRMH
ncbi:hypothetical protein AcW1_008199 [Taiwanofungus camphoratus]|nr:hypothetical protein AcV5_008496 [Antrodia cinnamomea]KAI0951057.1 hypothetical protein AcW1_008199 [Antrodia cinnamomea]KAI0955953.1 hypothetical protein AcV7_006485 [Antrodia cinnamomea]